jgi:hypothetical protein
MGEEDKEQKEASSGKERLLCLIFLPTRNQSAMMRCVFVFARLRWETKEVSIY